MNQISLYQTRRALDFSLAAARPLAAVVVATVLGSLDAAEDMYRGSLQPGGVPAQATITSTAITPTNATVCWYGMQGWYSVEMSTNLSAWSSVGRGSASAHAWCMTVTNTTGGTNSVFYRLAQSNGYVGSGGCAGCHASPYGKYMATPHAMAYSSPSASTNFDLVSRTVGYGQPSGFTDSNNTPHLANVGCENCHGPSAWHKYSDHDLIHPAVTVASEVCGGCHNGPRHPTYTEWTNTLHARVDAHVEAYFLDPDPVVGQQRQMGCGSCHSAATRLAMLAEVEGRIPVTNVWGYVTNVTPGVTNYMTLPSPNDAAAFGQTCATCHDPHEKYNHAQLRNPKFSTNFFTLSTSYVQTNVVRTNFAGVKTTNVYFLNTVFATNYNARVQICGQCHNTRGAMWQSSSRPPHHSPQYNVLIGAVQADYLNGTNINMIATHGRNTNGCVRCHMHSTTVANPTEANPNYTGHQFNMRVQGCVGSGCHGSTNTARFLLLGMEEETQISMGELVGLLEQWATDKAPAITNAFTNYYQYAWEYTTAGQLSNPTGTNTFPGSTNLIAGPPANLQSLIPNPIKQARFNLYLVEHDHSGGVHNPLYVRHLLSHGISNVNYQLSLP